MIGEGLTAGMYDNEAFANIYATKLHAETLARPYYKTYTLHNAPIKQIKAFSVSEDVI